MAKNREVSQLKADHYNRTGTELAQIGRFDEAIKAFRKSIKHQSNPNALYFLGLAHHLSGKISQAKKWYNTCIREFPEFSMAHNNLGAIYLDEKNFTKAILHFEAGIRADANNSFALNNLGNAYKSVGKIDEAIQQYQKALILNPELPEAYNNLGIIAFEQGKEKSALKSFNKALQVDPNYYQAWYHLSVLYVRQDKYLKAKTALEKFHSANQGNGESWSLLGNVYLSLKDNSQAVAALEKAVTLSPRSALVLNDLGNAYKHCGESEKALKCYQKTLELQPDLAGTMSNLATIYLARNKLSDARQYLEKAITLHPGLAQAWYHLGLVLEKQGQLSEAKKALDKALQHKPDLGVAMSLGVYVLMQMMDFDELKKWQLRLDTMTHRQLQEKAEISESAFVNVVRQADPQENLQVAKLTSALISRQMKSFKRKYDYNRKAINKIKIGYLSCDFHDHATLHLLEPILKLHNKEKFEIFLYSWGIRDYYTELVQRSVANMRFIDDLSALEAADKIYADGIDILVDLKGFTHGARTEILALKPAPIQINWLGFPGTSGADFMDYVIVDKTIGKGAKALFTEKMVTMPVMYQPNSVFPKNQLTTFTRAEVGLNAQSLVLTNLGASYKITSRMIESWTDILIKYPNCQLWLLDDNKAASAVINRIAKKKRVTNQIVWAKRWPHSKHISRLALADIFLDTYPCGGHTSASDSLDMAVPIITQTGPHMASRVAASLLMALGMPKLITTNHDTYVDTIETLINDPKQLAEYKQQILDQQQAKSGMYDTQAFVKSLEKAYAHMWQRYLSGKACQEIQI